MNKQETKDSMEDFFDNIGRKFRERVDIAKEFEITAEEPLVETGFIPSFILDFKYLEAQKLKIDLLDRYEGAKIEDVLSGEELTTEMGACYCLSDHTEVSLIKPDKDEMRKKILSDLKLIFGIREKTELQLKRKGYKTIKDLIGHPRFRSKAKEFLTFFDEFDLVNIIDCIGKRFPKSHPLMLYASGLYNKEDFVFLDIETLGFFTRPIILFGIAHISGKKISISQYLLRDISEEAGAIAATLSHFKESAALVTYNGRAFDVPYIQERVAYYGMDADLKHFNIDLLHFSRRAWKEHLPNCRLNTIENHLLGIKREDDVPNTLIPDFYDTYLKTENPGPLIPIVDHNKQDLISLASIFSKLWDEWK
ncbi:ribonuclease H-like domain-containing protein [Candidatus Borrarchaeum sp.]|uniref:ribonuclease H-like domain-containing protein n=1 Tax=Candidatus Borrarchaeum sp. TaxID=2846742 RepID=UPI00257F292D|nr:ribonuclease H-like domain-containing protein [Candidatus Borrarchaeum sp.]